MYFQFLYIASLLIILLFSFFNRVDYLIILSTGFPCKYNFFHRNLLKSTCLFTGKRFDLCINTVCIQSILLQKFQSRTGLTKRIIDPDLHHPGRCFLRKYVTYCTSQSTDHGMFLYCYDPAGLSCRRYDQLLIQWFDGMDVDDFRINPVSCQLFCCFQTVADRKSGCDDRQVFSFS